MTREEAIKVIRKMLACTDLSVRANLTADMVDACHMAIKALEQEPIIDKIRAEIEKAVWEDVVVSLDGTDEVRILRLDPDDVFEIIDKYKAETEVEDGN